MTPLLEPLMDLMIISVSVKQSSPSTHVMDLNKAKIGFFCFCVLYSSHPSVNFCWRLFYKKCCQF